MKNDLPAHRFGRELLSRLAVAEFSEWIVTNGLGGYSSSSLVGLNTRGYHGLLVAALDPPVDRRLVLAGLVEVIEVNDSRYELSTLRWADGSVSPTGYVYLEEVTFEGTLPTWRFVGPDFILEKSLVMVWGENRVEVEYKLIWSSGPVKLSLSPITASRDYHSREFGGENFPVVTEHGSALMIDYPNLSDDIVVSLSHSAVRASPELYRSFDLSKERERGLSDSEDHICAGRLDVVLSSDKAAVLVASIGRDLDYKPKGARAAELLRQKDIIKVLRATSEGSEAPDWIAQLVLASDQFVVKRFRSDGSEGRTIIAGYPWFADWGRDTMIALTGVCLSTGRTDIAKEIIKSFSDVIDAGMVPNRFPDQGEAPEYNTVDATFWFITAVKDFFESTGDIKFLKELFPTLVDMVSHLVDGTRYNIKIDEADGLISAGSRGVQLTWMDARVGEWVVTPRMGKPIEVNAKWIEGLQFMSGVAKRCGVEPGYYEKLLLKARKGFERFWNAELDYCFDVIDGPLGNDATLRPNQIFAARPDLGLLSQSQSEAVVNICQRHLLTPAGLRSLAPFEPGYAPSFTGPSTSRDAAYHQGTVWGWLIGPFINAHLATFKNSEHAAQFLEPFKDQLLIECFGTINEVFEGGGAQAAKGCVAQAWSVGEVLRAWKLINLKPSEELKKTLAEPRFQPKPKKQKR